jgi:hypothetical protein
MNGMRLMKSLLSTVLSICFVLCLLALHPSAVAQADAILPQLPTPDAVMKDDRQLNVMKLGPGNQISFGKVPDDFELDNLSFSPDGKELYFGWASGRLEEREITSNQKIAELKTGKTPVFEVVPDKTHHRFLIVTDGRKIRFIDDQSGKEQKVLSMQAGEQKYDIQTLVLAKDASYLAYATQDSGKVISVTDGSVIADLGEAYDVILSQSGQELWVLYRNEISEWKVGEWKRLKSITLPNTPSSDISRIFTVVEGSNGPVAFAGSAGGLVQVGLNDLSVRVITTLPTHWIGKTPNGVVVAEKGSLHFYDPDGHSLCRWQLTGAYKKAVSNDGSELAYRLADSTEVWNMNRLMSACPAN